MGRSVDGREDVCVGEDGRRSLGQGSRSAPVDAGQLLCLDAQNILVLLQWALLVLEKLGLLSQSRCQLAFTLCEVRILDSGRESRFVILVNQLGLGVPTTAQMLARSRPEQLSETYSETDRRF